MSTGKNHFTDIFSTRLKTLKGLKKVTQERIAMAANVGQPTVSAWLKGEYLPGGEEVCKLADYFGVTTDELLGRSETASAFLTVALRETPDEYQFDDIAKEMDDLKEKVASLDRAIKRLKK